MSVIKENIEETTVWSIGKWRVGIGNIWEREYVDANGACKNGLTAIASLFDENTKEEHDEYLGIGSVLDLGDDGLWKLVDIEGSRGTENGSLTLSKVEDKSFKH